MHSLFGLGIQEIGILVLVVLFLFGGTRIKELIKTFGHGYKEVNNVKRSIENEVKDSLKDIVDDHLKK